MPWCVCGWGYLEKENQYCPDLKLYENSGDWNTKKSSSKK